MLSLDFAEIAIIDMIATARIMAAIVPNSGTTKVPIISISSACWNITVIFLQRFQGNHSSPSTSTMKVPSGCFVGDTVSIPSSSALILMTIELSLELTVTVTIPPEMLNGTHWPPTLNSILTLLSGTSGVSYVGVYATLIALLLHC